jgi:hypothetical protein
MPVSKRKNFKLGHYPATWRRLGTMVDEKSRLYSLTRFRVSPAGLRALILRRRQTILSSLLDGNFPGCDVVEVLAKLVDIPMIHYLLRRCREGALEIGGISQFVQVLPMPQRSGRSRSSTMSISPRAIISRSAANNACSSVMLIRGFDGSGMKLLAYAGPLFLSSI